MKTYKFILVSIQWFTKFIAFPKCPKNLAKQISLLPWCFHLAILMSRNLLNDFICCCSNYIFFCIALSDVVNYFVKIWKQPQYKWFWNIHGGYCIVKTFTKKHRGAFPMLMLWKSTIEIIIIKTTLVLQKMWSAMRSKINMICKDWCMEIEHILQL